MTGRTVRVLPVVVLDLHMMPLSVRDASNNVNLHLSALGTTSGEHKFDSFILNGERDKIMFSVVSSIVQQKARLLYSSELQLEVEFKALCEGWQREEGSITEAPGLKLTELVVEGTLGAVLTDEAALDERGTGGGRGTDVRC